MSTTSNPRPFLKWVGGKTQLLPELRSRLPKQYDRYFEPFLGGGALFWDLLPERAVLSDANLELINAYRVVRNDVEWLIESLKEHVYEKDYYYRIREWDRSDEFYFLSPLKKASRFIYLNKTCFNGLHRVNAQGHFNVPMGDYKNPLICDEENLRACSEVLQKVELYTQHFQPLEPIVIPESGDFVYFDPPYAPLSATSDFTSYNATGFSAEAQAALRDYCITLDKRGVKWMLSNSSAPMILDLYRDFNVELVDARRSVNCKGGDRGSVKEVIVRNYR
jgi:DNA adenine methylase